MNYLMLILLTMVGLEGCATAEYGNFTAQTPHTPQALNATLLTDTVKQLEALSRAPTHSALALSQHYATTVMPFTTIVNNRYQRKA